MKKIILAGMPNCGKSSVFNMLTGAHAYVGNRAGVTVSAAEEKIKGLKFDGEELLVTDIPGITSLIPSTADEEVASELLFGVRGDLFINVVDATNFEKQLPLTLRLIELSAGKSPFLLCITMRDLFEKRDAKIDTELLSKLLGNVPAVFISATEKSDASILKNAIISALRGEITTPPRFAADVRSREKFIADICGKVISGGTYESARREKLEKILSSGLSGLLIFLLSILGIMFIAFGPIGNFLTEQFENRLAGLIASGTGNLLAEAGIEEDFAGLLLRGISVGSIAVLSLFPRIILVSLCLAALEDCGYMARGASLCDPLMKKIGLDGRAAISAILGFGCTVPAVMSCRNMTDCGRRTVCCSLLPLIGCSARVPVYSLIATAFFGRLGWVVAFLIHLLGACVFLFLSAVLKRRYVKAPAREAQQILPPLRLPYFKYVVKTSLAQTRHFLMRAGGLILGVTCVLFLLMSYSPDFMPAAPQNSILAAVGSFFTPDLTPLGFDSWQAAVSLICGFGAKEAVVSALSVLCPTASDGSILLSAIFTPQSALSFLVFFSMYIPCVATVFTMINEIGLKQTIFAVFINFTAAFSLAFAVNVLAGMAV